MNEFIADKVRSEEAVRMDETVPADVDDMDEDSEGEEEGLELEDAEV